MIFPAIAAIKTVKNVAKNTDKRYLFILFESIFDLIIKNRQIPAGTSANKIKPTFITSWFMICL